MERARATPERPARGRVRLSASGDFHRDGMLIGRLRRHWRRVPGLDEETFARYFAIEDLTGAVRGWTLHWGDAAQLAASFLANPPDGAAPAPVHGRSISEPVTLPIFAIGDRVSTGFGPGVVLSVRRRQDTAPNSVQDWAHWRYRIQLDDGALADVAEAGVSLTLPQPA